jgi:Fic family protein
MDLARHPLTSFGEGRRTPGKNGYVAYFPASIPRALELPAATVRLLADAEGALGQLSGIGRLLPNPDLLIRPYLLREALSSTRIEGTQASIVEVIETNATGEAPNPDVEEVINYVIAMRQGLKRLKELPLSTRLLCEMHGKLMSGVRGRELSPGTVRTSQNWIGAPGSTIKTAQFVPPPPSELAMLLADWERFAHEQPEMPLLVQDALLHSQFETIHPFLDGNGRLGRLLLVFFLVSRDKLSAPLLYLSAYLERKRQDYYDALQAIHETGDAIPWIELFLTAVKTQAGDAVQRSQRIIELRERYRQSAASIGTANAAALVELICQIPIVTTKSIENSLGISRPTALRLLGRMEDEGVLSAMPAGARGQKRYVAHALMEAVTSDKSV